jgi:hypothetical protein
MTPCRLWFGISTNVSYDHTASILYRKNRGPFLRVEDESSSFIQSVCNILSRLFNDAFNS